MPPQTILAVFIASVSGGSAAAQPRESEATSVGHAHSCLIQHESVVQTAVWEFYWHKELTPRKFSTFIALIQDNEKIQPVIQLCEVVSSISIPLPVPLAACSLTLSDAAALSGLCKNISKTFFDMV